MQKSVGPIVHVIGELAAAGAEIFVKELCLALKKEGGFPVEVWTLYRAEKLYPDNPTNRAVEADFLKAFDAAGIRVRQLDKRPGRDYVKTWRTLKKWTRQVQPAVVHCHLEEVSFHVCLALGRTGVPLVQTMHSEQIRRPGLYRLFFQRYCRAFVAISAKVAAQTKLVMPALKERQLVNIPNGIPFDNFACPNRNYRQSPRRVLAVGRLVDDKNHRLMIEASAIIKAQEGEAGLPDLSIYGAGELTDELLELIKAKGLDDKIHLPGVSSNVPQLLRESDIYLMSSNKEGMSISLMEAMAAGLPIVVTAVSGIKDLLEDEVSALIVPVGDARAFATAYSRLLKDADLRERLGRKATLAVKPYSMTVCASRHLTLYRKLLDSSPGY